jgi:uncharacterized protein
LNKSFEQFQNQDFLNLQTFRKNGEGVATPVWFVQDGKVFYVRTIANSAKVKRIHNNKKVKIMPCGSQGEPLGIWVNAQAVERNDADTYSKMASWLAEKYGDQPRIFEAQATARGEKYTVLIISLER